VVTLDVVIAADLRLAAAEGVASDVRQLTARGLKVGLVHLPGRDLERDQPFDMEYRHLLTRSVAQLILPADSVRARLAVVHTAESVPDGAFTSAMIEADRALVIATLPPRRWARARYDVADVAERLSTVLGAQPSWVPLDPTVRRALSRRKYALTLTPHDWSDPKDRVATLLKLAGAKPRGKSTLMRKTEDVPLPERSHGVLIVDITGEDRPDTLLPAVRRETTDAERPRVVATSAIQAAEHAGDLAVETMPRTINALEYEDRRDYLTKRISSLLAGHQPDDVIVLDDFSTGVDVRSLLGGSTAKVWLVQPEGPVDLPPVDDTLGKRVADALPPGWVVSPVSSDFDDDDRGDDDGIGETADTVYPNKIVTRLRHWLATTGAAVTHLTRRALARRRPPEPLPTALIVAPEVHSDPEAAVRAIVRRQHETNVFRATALAPPDWEPVAAQHGLPIETLIPEPTWASIYGSGWREYVRQRVREASTVFGASTVVFTDNIADDVNVALDAVEASAQASQGHLARAHGETTL
jgi:hypothetical protein